MANATCTLTSPGLRRRGLRWLFGAFLFCPCHLPLTLALLASVTSGTIGLLIVRHTYVIAAIVTVVWLGGTWRAFRYFRAAQDSRAT